jgi:Mn-dependent DtxR family transcriptional regulator
MARLQHELYDFYGPVIWQVGDHANLPEATAEMLEFVLGNFDVSAISADLLWQRMPYIAPQLYERMLAGLIRAGLLVMKEDGRYQFTDPARQIGWQIYKAKHQRLGQLNLLPACQLEELAYILHRLVHASQVAAQPVSKRWLMSRCNYLAVNAPPLAQIVENLANLDAFRDDCHLAAWQQHQVDGRTWEAFTLLWQRGQLSHNQVAEQLNIRGYHPHDYQTALHRLSHCQWVIHQDGVYTLTAQGRTIRNQVEQLTNDTFYAPWSCLRGNELAQLYKLLTRLKKIMRDEL